MKLYFTLVDKYFVLLITMTVGVFLADLILLGLIYKLKSTEWASWVQAVGSIAAIFGAFWIGKHQADVQRHVAERARKDVLGDRNSTIKGVLDRVFQHCLNIEGLVTDPARAMDHPFAFLYIKTNIPAAQRLLDEIPLYELGSGELVHAVLDLKSEVQVLLTIADWKSRRIAGPQDGVPISTEDAIAWMETKLQAARVAYNAAIGVTGGAPRSIPEHVP